jgi:class 3 adenylate cyclase
MRDAVRPAPFGASADLAASDEGARIAGVLFADVVGFSALSDNQVRSFVAKFLGEIGRLGRRSSHTAIMANCWGDGLFYLFDTVADTGLFALELVDLVRREPWGAHQLPPDLTLRVAVHAGPLFAFPDPIAGRQNLWGRHITRAARIEPITPPGNVYATREFAALAAAQGITAFACEPVGRVTLAKKFGEALLYHVRRSVSDGP